MYSFLSNITDIVFGKCQKGMNNLFHHSIAETDTSNYTDNICIILCVCLSNAMMKIGAAGLYIIGPYLVVNISC